MCTLGMPRRGRELAAVDDRRAARRHRAHERGRLLRQPVAEEDQAVGFLALQHQRVAFFALLVVLRVADEHRIALALRGVFDALEDQRKERVGDVRHGDEQLAGAQRAQVLGGGVRLVAEALDRLHDLAARVGRDDARLAQHARDGGGRDAGALGDFVDVGHAARAIIPRRGRGRTMSCSRGAVRASLCNRLHW